MNTATVSTASPSLIPFHGQTLLAIKDDAGNVFIAMKPVVEGMGLSWPSQYRKFQENKGKYLSCHMAIQVHGDDQTRETLCIPLQKLNAWLFSVNPEKVRKDIRPAVVRYQEECSIVLYNYWHHGEAVNERIFPEASRAIPPRLTTGAERKPLAIAVNKVIGVNDEGPTRQKYMCFWRTLNAALGINHIDELTVDRLPAVRALLELLVNLVVSPTGGNVLATMPPNVEGLSHREQVFALQDWFDRSQKQFVDVAYTVERKILGLAKDADMSGLPAMERMHVKNMKDDTAHAFRDGMFSLQTVSNAVRPLFRVLASAVSMGGSKTTRPALPR